MIVLMGVAGSGKSMQGRLLADEHGYAWISTGEVLRVLITGKRRQEMLEGKLLADWEVIEILDKILDLINVKEEFVLDGFPRTVAQADWLLEQVRRERFELSAVVHLAASEDVVKQRLLKRGRQDDKEDSITERFTEYRSVTLPILKHLEEEGVPIFTIDAAQTAEEVHDHITAYLDGKTVE
jgi:adenylate kinase